MRQGGARATSLRATNDGQTSAPATLPQPRLPGTRPRPRPHLRPLVPSSLSSLCASCTVPGRLLSASCVSSLAMARLPTLRPLGDTRERGRTREDPGRGPVKRGSAPGDGSSAGSPAPG